METKKMHDRPVFERSDFQIAHYRGKRFNPDDLAMVSRTWHEEIEIKYFTEGSSTVLVDTEPIVTQPDDIILINPYEFHSTLDVGENSGKYNLLMIGMDLFSSKNLDNFDMKHLLLGRRIRFNNLIRGNSRIKQVVLNIIEELTEKDSSYELVVRGLVLELFALLLRSEVKDVVSEEYMNDNIRFYDSIEPAIEHIRTCYDQEITVDELANFCKMSKYHFCRIFKRATGMTAIQYLTEYKLSIADVLLGNSDTSISEIAHIAGFDDESYFSRCYKKSRGVSPKTVRAKNTK
ncbi:MAG: helix-turn-helix transcriptional regulator [Oscillospiraceae bacterium]|nr:helix-turn-helix transcriptional regulator [Oscillospiraceae bacterium]